MEMTNKELEIVEREREEIKERVRKEAGDSLYDIETILKSLDRDSKNMAESHIKEEYNKAYNLYCDLDALLYGESVYCEPRPNFELLDEEDQGRWRELDNFFEKFSDYTCFKTNLR